jgi:prepilin-type N-terminal cleavage/methylation domain-containing protein
MKSLAFNRKGLTLLELLLALGLLGVVISIAFTFFLFSSNTYENGTKKASIQNDTTLVTNAITGQLRNATFVKVFQADINGFAFDTNYTYIYAKNGNLIKRTSTENILVNTTKDNVNCIINFSRSNPPTSVLHSTVTGSSSSNTFSIDSEIQILNISNIDGGSAISGNIVCYTP